MRVFLKPNPHFRLPADPDRPIIMIGPGTGVAPFRAFMQERDAIGARGRNWLVFGHRNYTHDFLYQLEWQDLLKRGVLTRLDVAFSRDQPEKRYVQHALWDARRELFAGCRTARRSTCAATRTRWRRTCTPRCSGSCGSGGRTASRRSMPAAREDGICAMSTDMRADPPVAQRGDQGEQPLSARHDRRWADAGGDRLAVGRRPAADEVPRHLLQDDRDLRAERGRKKMEKAFIFMARLRVPGGVLTPHQWLAAEKDRA